MLIYRQAPQLFNLQPYSSGTKNRNFSTSDGRFDLDVSTRHSSAFTHKCFFGCPARLHLAHVYMDVFHQWCPHFGRIQRAKLGSCCTRLSWLQRWQIPHTWSLDTTSANPQVCILDRFQMVELEYCAVSYGMQDVRIGICCGSLLLKIRRSLPRLFDSYFLFKEYM